MMIEDSLQYSISLITRDKVVILFCWKAIKNCDKEDYKCALKAIAHTCKQYHPSLILIDRRKFTPNIDFDRSWWTNNILPVYHQVGILGFAHISRNPEVTGEYLEVPPGVNFKMGEFGDLESALKWEPESN